MKRISPFLACFAACALAACDSPGELKPPDDLSQTPQPDLRTPNDLSPGPDLAQSPDLSELPDLTDLTDLAVPPDFAVPVDFSVPPDLVSTDQAQFVPPYAVCSTAPTVGTGTYNGTTADGIDDLHLACRSGARGGNVYYQVTLQAFETLHATVTPLSQWDAVLRILDTCGAATCTFSDSGLNGAAETANFVNTTTSPKSIIVAVGNYDATLSGPFTLAIQIDPPSNSICAAPKIIHDGDNLVDENQSNAFDTSRTNTCNTSALGGMLFYQATVPPGQALRVRVTPKSAWDPVLRVLADCNATTCLTSADATATSGIETVVWPNPKPVPQTVLVAVGSFSATTTGKFDMSVSIAPAPTNTTCASAIPLTTTTTYIAQDLSVGTAATACGTSGKNLYYTVLVPAGGQLNVTETPNPAVDAKIRLYPACGSATCTASADTQLTTTTPEVLTYNNTTGADQTLILAVGTFSATTGTTDIKIEIAPPPANRSCTTPKPIVNGTVYPSEDPSLANQALSSVCYSAATGNVLYYSVAIDPNQTLSATVTPTGAWDPVIRLVDACPATACLAQVDNFPAGAAETLTYQNTTGSTQNLLVAVGSFAVATTGKFKLQVSLTP